MRATKRVACGPALILEPVAKSRRFVSQTLAMRDEQKMVTRDAGQFHGKFFMDRQIGPIARLDAPLADPITLHIGPAHHCHVLPRWPCPEELNRPRDCRRLFLLSHAAMAGASGVA